MVRAGFAFRPRLNWQHPGLREIAGMIHENIHNTGQRIGLCERRREFVARYCTRRCIGQLQRGPEHHFCHAGKGRTESLQLHLIRTNTVFAPFEPIAQSVYGSGGPDHTDSNRHRNLVAAFIERPKGRQTGSDINVQMILMKGERRFFYYRSAAAALDSRLPRTDPTRIGL